MGVVKRFVVGRFGVLAGRRIRLPLVLLAALAMVSSLTVALPAQAVVRPALSLTAPVAAETGLAFTLYGYGNPVRAGRVVTVQRLSGRSWVTLGSPVQSSKGLYSWRTSVTRAGKYTYRAWEKTSRAGAPAAVSASRVVTVHAPYILLAPSTAISAETVKVTGLLPGVASRPVWVQRLAGRTWVTVARVTTSRYGAYATAFRAPANGAYWVRTLAPRVTIARVVRAQYVTGAKVLSVVAQSAALTMPATLVQAQTAVAALSFAPVRVSRPVALQVLQGGVWTSVSTGVQSGSGAASLTFTAGTPGSYSYRPWAAAWAGAAAFAGAARTLVVTAPVPGPVTGVGAVPASTSIALSWTNPVSSSLAGVMVRRVEGATAPASATAGVLVTDSSGTSFTDSGLTPGTQYSYALFAHDATPTFAAPATVTSTTVSGPVTDLVATPASVSVALSWVNPAGATLSGVMIRRATGATPPATITDGVLVTDADAPATSFTDFGLTPGTQYSYALFAHDDTPRYAGATAVSTTTIAPGQLAGRVTDAAGSQEALANVRVNVTSEDSGTNGTAVTDSNGDYLVSGLAAGTDYAVCFVATDATSGGSSALGYVDECYDNQPVVGTPTHVAVISDETTAGVDAGLVGGGGIAGTVTDAAGTHEALAGVEVNVTSESTAINGHATTDASGGYTVSGLAAASDYQVCFNTSAATGGSSTTGYVDECFDNRTMGTPTSVAVVLGATSGADAALDGGGAIGGRVTDAAVPGQGLRGVEVWATSPTTGAFRTTLTGVDGSYTLPGLSGGTDYTVCFNGSGGIGAAVAFGYFDQCFDDQSTSGTAMPVTVLPAVTTGGIGAAMDPREEPHS
jgi:Carboxypeptidase regulatory-like domain